MNLDATYMHLNISQKKNGVATTLPKASKIFLVDHPQGARNHAIIRYIKFQEDIKSCTHPLN